MSAEFHSLTLDEANQADLLFNFHYLLPQDVVAGFRRSALLDIDPGLLQTYLSQQSLQIAAHNHYFTTGPNVGIAGAKFPDAGIAWKQVLPCVALDQWPVTHRGPVAVSRFALVGARVDGRSRWKLLSQ